MKTSIILSLLSVSGLIYAQINNSKKIIKQLETIKINQKKMDYLELRTNDLEIKINKLDKKIEEGVNKILFTPLEIKAPKFHKEGK